MEIVKIEMEKVENGIRIIEYHKKDDGQTIRHFKFKPNPVSLGIKRQEVNSGNV